MGYQPKVLVGRCRGCGGHPQLKHRFWRHAVRLECKCGVAGQWVVPDDRELHWWNAAARGWDAVSFPLPPAPLPS